MDIKIRRTDPLTLKTPCLVLGVFESKGKTQRLTALDDTLAGTLGRAWREREFTGESKQTLMLYPGPGIAAERVLLVGLGKEKEASLERLRQAGAAATEVLRKHRISSFATDLLILGWKEKDMRRRSQSLVEGVQLANYRFDAYRTEKRGSFPPTLARLALLIERSADSKAVRKGAEDAQIICDGVMLARDLVNEPGNVKSPDFLAARAKAAAKDCGFRCTILDRKKLTAEKMGALLGVAQGSVREPCLIIMEYQGGSGRPIALIGKGVVFDAGGISLKPAEKMDEMKMDMAGGAAVLGTMAAAARLKLPVNLIGLIPAVENMPSGSAIRPGDILQSMSGRSIEVLNTDAEGRLILADALTYAARFDPRVVIDLATLTGACIIALGHHATAVLGNHQGLVKKLIQAGEASGERLWQLPLWDDYAAQLKSDIADIKNIGGRPAGTITAAAFLQRFAEKMTWAHLDIAGTAWEEKGRHYSPKGATGVGVRLLVEYLGGAAEE